MEGVATYKIGNNGRLGNSLFQASGTMAYALDHNKEFIFPEWKYRKWFQKELPLGNPQIDIRIPVEFHFAEIPDYPNKNVELHSGQLQSWRYFARRWTEISPYFTLKDEHSLYIAFKYGEYLNQKNTCGIHIRRTDYITSANMEYHGIMPISYYKDGVKKIYGTEKPDNILFVICSDDIKWCKENFYFPNQIFIEGEEDIVDMFILLYCQNIIIANSSFSLFPAVVNTIKNPKYKVVAPEKWFGKAASVITKDIYMDGWILI